MELQKDYSCLERSSIVMERTVEAENDYQEALPAYCDDVYKIIKCAVRSSISSVEVNGSDVTVNVKLHICMTYLNDNACLCYADFEENLSKSVNAENLSDRAFAYATVQEKYVNYRVINQRRIDIHCAILLNIRLFDIIKCPCLVSCENARLKTETVETGLAVNSAVSKIEFDEDFLIPTDSDPIKRLVSWCANVTETDVRLIKDKVLVKGIVNLSVLYTTDGAQEQLQKAEYALNISKIIDVRGVEEGDAVLNNMTVSNVYLKAKQSSGDALRVISVFGEVCANLLFIRLTDESIITDGYILNRRSQNTFSDYHCLTGGKLIKDTIAENVSFDLPDEMTEIKEIYLVPSQPLLRGNKLSYKVTANIIGMTEDGDIVAVNSAVDMSYDATQYENAFAVFSLQSFDYRFDSGSSVEVRMNISASVFAYQPSNFKILSDLEPTDDTVDYPSLTVYFAKKKEALWDIAKQFSSDALRIAADNDLSGDVIDTDRIIIIPKV